MTQVGRYEIQEELGRGAAGVVYKALDPGMGRTLAIKAVPLGGVTDPEVRRHIREQLFREAEAAAVLSHPNIVTVFDIFEQDEVAYILMEYVPGTSLAKMQETRRVPDVLHLIALFRQVAEALDYAHRKAIVHRDIKPANLIIAAVDGDVPLAKIADFGVARFTSQEVTQNGTTRGTANYMSPEQIQGLTVDGRSDQFSLGVVVYEAFTGAKPFMAEELPTLFYAICKQEPPPANQVNPGLSEAAAKVLQRALMKDPEQRFSSCGEFIGVLSIALGATPLAINGDGVRSLPTGTGVLAVPDGHQESGSGTTASAPEEPSGDRPTRVRRRLDEVEEDIQSDQPPRGSSVGKKLAVILAMCFAIVAAIVFIVLSNSGPSIPVQVLDTREGPVTPPPAGMDVPSKGRTASTTSRARTSGTTRRRPEAAAPQGRTTAAVTDSVLAKPTVNEVREVELLSEPPGARMTVDGRSELSCSAPCNVSLSQGRHTLSAEMGGYNEGKRIFNTPEDTSVFVSLGKSMGVVVVTSALSGCTVLVDGRPSGQTPATLHLTAGSHRIAVVSRGSRHEETVQVRTDGFDVERFLCQ